MSAGRRAFREALPPAAIALAVTLLRLAGERLGWSAVWFSRDTGGVVPSRLGWVVGITWLALPVGAWFAGRLVRAGDRPTSTGRATAQALGAAALLYVLLRLLPALRLGFPAFLFPIWATAVVCAWIAWRAWPALGRTLLAYGVLSRLPVVVVMLLALRGHWGTHYDYADAAAFVRQMSLAAAFVWLALVPQLVFWTAYTVVAGTAAGTLTAALLRPRPADAAGRLRVGGGAGRGPHGPARAGRRVAGRPRRRLSALPVSLSAALLYDRAGALP
ncbi:MAG TPA: hypothetical protein VMX54_01005 [Vicinamibacteria bacterium]|nr:hypothetical protein [Vicinamibacteria bacterium]